MYRDRDGSPSLHLTEVERRAIAAYEASVGLEIAEHSRVGSAGWLTRQRSGHWAAAADYHRERASRLRSHPDNDYHPLFGTGHDAETAESDASACQFRADALAEARDRRRSEYALRSDDADSVEGHASSRRLTHAGPVQAFRVGHSPLQIAAENYESLQEAIDDVSQFARERHGLVIDANNIDNYAIDLSGRDDAPLFAWQFTEGEHFEIRALDCR